MFNFYCYTQINLPFSYNGLERPMYRGFEAWEDGEGHPPIILPFILMQPSEEQPDNKPRDHVRNARS